MLLVVWSTLPSHPKALQERSNERLSSPPGIHAHRVNAMPDTEGEILRLVWVYDS